MRTRGPESRAAVRLEVENERAWCGDRLLDLPPKPFAVLRHLVEHAGRLVTKAQLLEAVWSDTVVGEAVLTSCIRDIRRELADSSRAPRYVETVHRRGFRFIGRVGPAVVPTTHPVALAREARLAGRDAERARLRERFAQARDGRRQLVFITGEPGIGKTTLVEAFVAELAAERGSVRIGHGQCVEHYGAGEAYLPLLEALGRLAREADGATLVEALRRHAPSWLAQLPALLSDDELAEVRQRAGGTTRDRMIRELVEALDVVGRDVPLVLVLEDLHWSDSGTVDVLAMLARRREPARLLVLATYRPVDVTESGHPLRAVQQELVLHDLSDEVALGFLDEAAVGAYLDERFPHAALPASFAGFLHRNTSGNPLFLVNVLHHLIAAGRLREVDGRWQLAVHVDDLDDAVPHTLRQLVEKQIEALTPAEQAVLATASVAGAELSAALLGADGGDFRELEAHCAALAARGRFLRADGTTSWPDGTVAGRYAFVHAIFREVLSARVPAGRRAELHRRIGARLEAAFGDRAGEIAGELAMHFDEGRDVERAVRWRQRAAENALRQYGFREAARHAARALALVAELPESPARDRSELAVLTTLGAALIPLGATAADVVRSYARARELSDRVGLTPDLFPVLVGLFRFYVSRAEIGAARELAAHVIKLAAATKDAAVALGAHNAAGMVAIYSGDFTAAVAELERGVAVYDPEAHGAGRSPVYWSGHDSGVSCAVHAAWALWALGRPIESARRMEQGLAWARAAAYPFTLANASTFAAILAECRRDVAAVRAIVDSGVLDSDHGFELLTILAALHRGWLAGDPDAMRASVSSFRARGGGIGAPAFMALTAEAYANAGRAAEGLAVVDEAVAMADAGGAHYWDADLHRVRGALMLLRDDRSAVREAEACFHRAIDVARAQAARMLELRATTSLARIWQGQGKSKADEARTMLAHVSASFDASTDSVDVREAKALLAELGETPTRRP